MSSKNEKARTWVNGYAVAGAAAVAAAVFPGSTSLALVAIETHMCYQIGKIYRGDEYSMAEAVAAAGLVELASIAGKLAALEALNLLPFAGWIVKAPVAAGVIKGLGEVIIAHYEKLED
jgi:uncharacterized protein (DUF697 family)